MSNRVRLISLTFFQECTKIGKLLENVDIWEDLGIRDNLIELGLDAHEFGRTSITLRCQARNLVTGKTILSIERIVMVGLDEQRRIYRTAIDERYRFFSYGDAMFIE